MMPNAGGTPCDTCNNVAVYERNVFRPIFYCVLYEVTSCLVHVGCQHNRSNRRGGRFARLTDTPGLHALRQKSVDKRLIERLRIAVVVHQ